ncbi:hypothetical protein I4U23_011748 [Adineta vaga]|nr:hypothetical protein I4U23_011748 [Adineta vaga]
MNYLKIGLNTYIDGIKFIGGSFFLMPENRLRDLIDVAHKHSCYVSTGGYIERVLASSADDWTNLVKFKMKYKGRIM